jgi:hypothetical protein
MSVHYFMVVKIGVLSECSHYQRDRFFSDDFLHETVQRICEDRTQIPVDTGRTRKLMFDGQNPAGANVSLLS